MPMMAQASPLSWNELLTDFVGNAFLMRTRSGIELTRALTGGGYPGSAEKQVQLVAEALERPENEFLARELRARIESSREFYRRISRPGLENEFVFSYLEPEIQLARSAEGGLQFVRAASEEGSFRSNRFAFLEQQGLEAFRLEQVLSDPAAATVRDTSEFVALLPESIRGRFTLMFSSRSAQGSSPGNPRAILFSSDGELFIGIGGNPANPRSRTVEVLQRDPLSGKFTAKAIRFKPEGGIEVDHKPKACAGCHGDALLPIWDLGLKGDVWPGAHGSTNSSNFETRKTVARYEEYQKAMVDRSPLFAALPKLSTVTDADLWTRNLELTRLIERSQAKSMVARLKALPAFEKHASALRSALAGTEAGGLTAAEARSAREWAADRASGHLKYNKSQIERASDAYPVVSGKSLLKSELMKSVPDYAKLARFRVELERMGAEDLLDDSIRRFAVGPDFDEHYAASIEFTQELERLLRNTI